jgi:transcriptional regulator with XRE-family HTH domain
MSRCRYIRKAVFGMTQTQFADMLGIWQGAVADLERRDALPAKHQITIRKEAAKRGLTWRDDWFFETPEAAQ